MIRELAARLRPNDSPASWVRGLLVSLAAAAFLSLAGAFGSGELGLAGAFAYWAVLLVVGYAWGSFLAGQAELARAERAGEAQEGGRRQRDEHASDPGRRVVVRTQPRCQLPDHAAAREA